ARKIWIVGSAVVSAFIAVAVVAGLVIKRTSRTLHRAVHDLSETAGQVSSAAAQVAASSQTLAQGSSEQAASVEETSASAEQVRSMIHRASDNTQLAVNAMDLVDQGIKQGNSTLETMLTSMAEITASSGKIYKIIRVIDEIAFQTNILALNAAVEA